MSDSRLSVEALEAREVPAVGLDPTFGTAGIATDPLAGSKFQSVAAVAAAPAGKIVAAGNLVGAGQWGADGDVVVARLTSAGAADTAFSGDGIATFSFALPHTTSSVATLPDGRIVVAGAFPNSLGESGNLDLFVMRLNADGTRDASFGTNGEVAIDLGGNDQLRRVAVQVDGKIVLAGSMSTGQSLNPSVEARMTLVRLTAAGARDTSFGTNGAVIGAARPGAWSTGGLAIQADGKVVLSGHLAPVFSITDATYKTELEVLRFNSNGTADATFGTAGRAATTYGLFNFAYANAVTVLSDGRVVAAGGSSYGQGLLAWFDATGTLVGQEQFGDGAGLRWITELAANPTGGVTAVGHAANAPLGGFAVESHPAPGTTGPTLQVNSGSMGAAAAIVAAADGKFVVAGVSGQSLMAARFADPGTTESRTTFVRTSSAVPMPAGPVTLTAQVVPLLGFGVNEGTVTFREGSTVLGTVDLAAPTTLPSPFWSASLLTNLSAGSHTITMDYSGTTKWAASSASVTLTLSPAIVANVELQVDDTNPAIGEEVSLAALVRLPDGTAPSGIVTFYDGGVAIGTGLLANGTAWLHTSFARPGTRTVTARFMESVSQQITVDVSRAYTGTALSVPVRTGVVGQPFEMIAMVTAPAGVVPGGRVTFYDGRTILGTAPVENGRAVFRAPLQIGARTLRASYTGDAMTFGSDSAPVGVTIQKATTSTTLTAPSTTAAGLPITLTATVRVVTGVAFPIGTVEFREGTRVLGTAAVDGRGGARLVVPSLTPGAHAITAVYLGSSTSAGSTSPAATVTVGGSTSSASTTTTLVTPPPAVYGQTQSLIAQLGSSRGVPSGRVNFFDGANLIGSAAVDARGNATLVVRQNLGVHRWKAVFAPTGAFLASESAVVVQTVGKAATTSSVEVLADVIRVRVRPASDGSPIGTVTLRKAGVVVGTAAVNGNGVATFARSLLGVGPHRLVAEYSGSSVFLGSATAEFAA